MRILKSFIICLLLITVPVFASSIKTDVLIFTHDNGDTADLVCVAKQLEKDGVDYKIAALGVSTEKLQADPHYVDLSSACKLSVPLKGSLDKNLTLNAADLKNISTCVQARVCLIPMSHRVLADISTALPEFISVVAYYDNMDSMKTAGFVQPFLEAEKRIDTVIVPSKKTLKESKGVNGLEGVKLVALGKPSLEDWEDVKISFTEETAQDVFKALGLNPKAKPVILFAGGRLGSYEKYFPILVEGVKDLDVQVWVTYHPATDGSFEKKVIDEKDAKNFTLVSKKPEIGLTDPTAQLSLYAKMFACNQTSVDIKAAYMGLPILYVNDMTYSPSLKEITKLVSTPADVNTAVQQILKSSTKPDLQEIGLPQNGSRLIAEFIEGQLKR